jgi:hypothetical protein
VRRNPILQALARKGVDKKALAHRLLNRPELLPEVVQGLGSDRPAIRYGCGAVLAQVGALDASLLAPWRDRFVALLGGNSRILRWNATRIVGSLAASDPDGSWFDEIFDQFFAPIRGGELIAAANVIGSAAGIALARPGTGDRIARELLSVERARYRTRECCNVALGQAIAALDCFYERLSDPGPVLAMVRRQLKNPRLTTEMKATGFLGKRQLMPDKRRKPSLRRRRVAVSLAQ